MSPRILGSALALGLGALLLTPESLLAWGPATHVYLGLEVLGSLKLVAPAMGTLLARHAPAFLYGNLAGDITVAKSYAPEGRHPHAWHVAREMYETAGNDPALRAAAAGYLCHLASDVIAHESYVPRMLLLTSSSKALGHQYWEHRMDVAVGPEYAELARDLVTDFDHSAVDDLLEETLARTLFSFQTNRRIFRGMVRIAGDERWQWIFDTVVDNSRWDLHDVEVDRFLDASFEITAGYLREGEDSSAASRDPTGSQALMQAKRIRRDIVRHVSRPANALRRAADQHFPLPAPDPDVRRNGGTTRTVAEEVAKRIRARRAGRRAS